MSAPARGTFPVKVLGNPDLILEAGITLNRIKIIYSHLESLNGSREAVLKKIRTVWENAAEAIKSSPSPEKVAIDALKQIEDPTLEAIYDFELRMAKTAEQFEKTICRFKKDHFSLQTPPLVQTTNGINGPTYLVRYHRSSCSGLSLKSYVVKNVGNREVECNQLMEKLLRVAFKKSQQKLLSARWLI